MTLTLYLLHDSYSSPIICIKVTLVKSLNVCNCYMTVVRLYWSTTAAVHQYSYDYTLSHVDPDKIINNIQHRARESWLGFTRVH